MMKNLKATPKENDFRMPGEFEPHEGCWITWPERPDNWRLGAKPAQADRAAQKLCGHADNIHCAPFPAL
jgi:agmatine deiminase